MARILLGLFLCLWAGGGWAAVVVRVQNTPGGPQIFVNGQPVPPRFFWGTMNNSSVSLTPEWQNISFEVMPGPVDGTGTLHFRFAPQPAEIWLAEVRIQDAQTGEDIFPVDSFATAENLERVWSVWPPGEANTVGQWEIADGALHITLRQPPQGPWPDFHFYSRARLSFAAGRVYRVSLRARSQPATVLRPQLYNVQGGVWNYVGWQLGPLLQQVALARDAGVHFVSFSAPNCWNEPEKPQDWRPLDTLCRQIIAVNPRALLVPRVSANAPSWWLQRHPEARMIFDETIVDEHHASVSDRRYRAAACAHLEKLCRHLMEAFPDNFAGIHPCGQHTGEWFYERSWTNQVSGYDPATRAAFREWLQAQGDPHAATAEPPKPEERRAHPYGLLRDPAQERRLIDFARFQQEEMASFVTEMAAACRRGTNGEKLVIFFYGYLFEFPPLATGAPTSGHYALSKVLASRDIDILCSPISYTDRDWLGTAPCMSAAESVMQAGILWLNEDDSRTFLDTRREEHVQEGGLVDLLQTQQVMLRNTAQEALRGFGCWWMDLPGTGWFNDARIWEVMTWLRPVDGALARRQKPFTPDIAAIVDEDSMCHLPGGSAAMARPLIYEGRAALGRSGAPYGQYILEDVLAGKVPARLKIFLSAWALSPQKRAQLLACRQPQEVRVWCYAPGYIYPDRRDAAGIKELTGFSAREIGLPTVSVEPTEAGRQAGLQEGWQIPGPIQPLFAVEAAPAETWARYPDGSPAVAVRRSPEGIDVFVGIPKLTPELVRALAKLAGVHIFTEDNSPVWATEEYISLQAHKEGPVLVNTGSARPVVDALNGMTLGTGPLVRLQMKQGEVRVLRY